MQDRDTQLTSGVDVGVEGDWVFEGQGRWGERVVGWEGENAAEIASCSREIGKLINAEDKSVWLAGERD